jgi:hypothetical protein
MSNHMSILGAAGMAGIAIVVAGCASSVEPPTSQKRAAESSVQQAVSSDARNFEPVLLNQAQNKLADAEELMDDEMSEENYQKALHLLEQASVDAQLAGARADTAKAKQAVEEINRNIESLRQRMNGSQ